MLLTEFRSTNLAALLCSLRTRLEAVRHCARVALRGPAARGAGGFILAGSMALAAADPGSGQSTPGPSPGTPATVPIPSADPTVWVDPDGAVTLRAIPATEEGKEPPIVSRRFVFGLPGTSSTRRELEGDALPLARTQWNRNGIRYTQLVLLTRLGPGELFPEGRLPADSVLLVQITGENTASEYTEATAEFAVASEGRRLELELRDGRVHTVGGADPRPLAVIDVPTTGVAGTRGTGLGFRGSMPPGTSGAMTIKIPLAPLTDETAVTRLFELEFDDEFRRVKRYWADRLKAGSRLPRLLTLVEAVPATSPKPASR